MPVISDPVTIDGSTQSGHVANTNPAPLGLNGTQVVEIEGSLTGPDPAISFATGSDGSTLNGLVIGGFSGIDSEAIVIDGSHNITLTGLYVGTDATGLVENANNYGTWVVGASTNLRIGGTDPSERNLFAGNVQANIQLVDAPGAQILGNLVGVDVTAAMDMSIQMKTESGKICTLSLSFNNDGPLGTFFRYICDNGTYIARYDDLVDGHEEPVDVSNVDVSMNGIELQDREFFAAINEGREPNSSVQQVLDCYRVLHAVEQQFKA